MATLTNSDYVEIRDFIKEKGYWDDFQSMALDKQTWKSVFQAYETWMVNAFNTTPTSSIKAALEVETGALTNAQAKAIVDLWFCWKRNHL